MSDAERPARPHDRDRGMTLTELLVSITMIALIATVISTAIIVTLRQQPRIANRLNAAGSEQEIGMWLPADLGSALSVRGAYDLETGAPTAQVLLTPCPGAGTECPGQIFTGGSYAALIQWRALLQDPEAGSDGVVSGRQYSYTNVAYYFVPDFEFDNGSLAGEPEESAGVYRLVRVECTVRITVPATADAKELAAWRVPGEPSDPTNPASAPNPGGGGWQCSGSTAARLDLTKGQLGGYGGWYPGQPVPPSVFHVTSALRVDADSDDVSQVDANSTARRVVVTVNSGGGVGSTTFSVTAGGTQRTEMETVNVRIPDITAAFSNCGGPITLLVDLSLSVRQAGGLSFVRDSVREFVRTLVGTPVRLQIIPFGDRAELVGGTGWNHYFDLTDTSPGGAVEQLLGPAGTGAQKYTDATKGHISYRPTGFIPNPTSGSDSLGYTNWEDAMFRAVRSQDGLIPQTLPETVILFTDGVPTRDRSHGSSYRSDTQNPLLPADDPAWNTVALTTDLYEDSFNRALHWANLVRGPVDLVGVYVGSNASASSVWRNRPVGYVPVVSGWEKRATWTYERRRSWTYESNLQFQSAALTSTVDFERATSYETNQVFQKATAFQTIAPVQVRRLQYRTSTTGGWQNVTNTTTLQTFFNQQPSNRRMGGSSTTWVTLSQAQLATLDVNTISGYTSSNLRVNGTNRSANTLSNWWTVPEWLYDLFNSNASGVNGQSDGWRIANTAANTEGAWTSVTTITPAAYAAGIASARPEKFRINGTGPWQSVPESLYDANNVNNNGSDGGSDGWRISPTTSWTDVTPTQYHAGVTGAGTAHKFRINGTRAAYNVTSNEWQNLRPLYNPADWQLGAWTSTTIANYISNNSTPDDSDGWRINPVAGSWVGITAQQYEALNVTGDDSDGVRKTPTGSNSWTTTNEADFVLHDVVAGESDGYRKRNSTGVWVPTTEAEYNFYYNSPYSAERSGYRASVYEDITNPNPTHYQAPTVANPAMPNIEILGRLIAGSPNFVLDDAPPYVTDADVYKGDWAQVSEVLRQIALGECGGTLTISTKSGNSYVASPFQYQEVVNGVAGGTATTNIDNTTDTFEWELPDGTPLPVEIKLFNLGSLTGFAPASSQPWSCRAGARVLEHGVDFTVTPDAETAPWPKLSLNATPNEALSCELQVVPA